MPGDEEELTDLDQLIYEPTTPGVEAMKKTSPDDPNEFLLSDDEMNFDEILEEEDFGDDE
jgi:hypothetical protein